MVQMLLHPWLYLVVQMLYANLNCPDVIEHYVRHRCYHAYFGCTDVICNLIAQMLLSIVSGTDVLMPVSYNILLAQMLMCLICGQDVIKPIFNYFIFSSRMLNNKLSQMCGRLYFPIFLLSVGLFTLIYIDSLIVLAKLLSSLPIILKFSMDVSWPLML